jgi:hypothetical protein
MGGANARPELDGAPRRSGASAEGEHALHHLAYAPVAAAQAAVDRAAAGVHITRDEADDLIAPGAR